jgi:hypothetical protein
MDLEACSPWADAPSDAGRDFAPLPSHGPRGDRPGLTSATPTLPQRKAERQSLAESQADRARSLPAGAQPAI